MFFLTTFLLIYVSMSTTWMVGLMDSSSTITQSTESTSHVADKMNETSTKETNATSFGKGTTDTPTTITITATIANTSNTTSAISSSVSFNMTIAASTSSTNFSPTSTSTISVITTESTSITTAAASTAVKADGSPQNLAAAVVPAVVVPVIVLAILVAVILLYWKRTGPFAKCGQNSETSSEIVPVLPEQTSIVVPRGEFKAYLENMKKECDFKYAEQFESLQLVGREQSTDSAMLKCNLGKNRYLNIHPYDVTRVKLLPTEGEEGTDYINASWIPGYYSKREYIAAQGPLPATVDDMWRMVWEYNCKGIIMLTKCIEAGRKKCDQYWPDDSEPVVYGDMQVVVVDEASVEDKWNIKKLEIAMGQHKRYINLFHFICWPDSGVPPSVDLLLTFMKNVKNEIGSTRSGPLIIHCSAGVGRTGTYIAIETLLQQLENENQIDVFGVVYRLRMNRVFMVQTESQFKFIHEAVDQVISRRYENNLDSSDHQPMDASDVIVTADEINLIPVEVESIGTENRAFQPSSLI